MRWLPVTDTVANDSRFAARAVADGTERNHKLAASGDFRYPSVRTLFLSVPAYSANPMKAFLHSRDAASKGAALMIVLAFVVLLTGLVLAYFSRAGTDRQLAQLSYNDTSADLLARSALDIVVGDLKQEILSNPTITRSNIQPSPYQYRRRQTFRI